MAEKYKLHLKILCLLAFISSFSCVHASSKLLSLNSLNNYLSSNQIDNIDTIYIKSGVYSNVRVKFLKKENLTVLPENNGEVIIEGKSSFTVEGSKNLRFSQLIFNQSVGTVFQIIDSKGIRILNSKFISNGNNPAASLIKISQGSQANFISYNLFENNKSICVNVVNNDSSSKLGVSKNNIISNNIFKNVKSVKEVYPNSNGNGMEAIQIGQMTSASAISNNLNTHIHNNIFENYIGDGVEIISVKSSFNFIYDNDFFDSPGGVTIRAGNNNTIRGNQFVRIGRAIRLYGSNHCVENNYLNNVEVGIMIPNGNLDEGDELVPPTGYYRAKNYSIENNIFDHPLKYAFDIGNNERILLPKDILIKNNKIFSKSSKRKSDLYLIKTERGALDISTSNTLSVKESIDFNGKSLNNSLYKIVD